MSANRNLRGGLIAGFIPDSYDRFCSIHTAKHRYKE